MCSMPTRQPPSKPWRFFAPLHPVACHRGSTLHLLLPLPDPSRLDWPAPCAARPQTVPRCITTVPHICWQSAAGGPPRQAQAAAAAAAAAATACRSSAPKHGAAAQQGRKEAGETAGHERSGGLADGHLAAAHAGRYSCRRPCRHSRHRQGGVGRRFGALQTRSKRAACDLGLFKWVSCCWPCKCAACLACVAGHKQAAQCSALLVRS